MKEGGGVLLYLFYTMNSSYLLLAEYACKIITTWNFHCFSPWKYYYWSLW